MALINDVNVNVTVSDDLIGYISSGTTSTLNTHPNIEVFDNMQILSEDMLLELVKSNPTRSVARDIMTQKDTQSKKVAEMCLSIAPDLYVSLESKEKWACDLIKLCKLELL